MASILLSTAGASLGAASGVPFGALIGRTVGRVLGGAIDNRVLGSSRSVNREGPRLEDLAVQTSTYGKFIPIPYGNVRLAGNVIWSLPIKETVTTSSSSSSSGGKGGSGKVTQTTSTYSYSVTLAIAICAGPIDSVVRVWADSKQLDLSLGTYRFYKGDETQLPDTLIEAIEGVGKTPAYRGLAYVVIEDFPLADYGNRIPNFTFEVKKKALFAEYQGQAVEEMVESIIMIPGSGEFVYDTQVQVKIPGAPAGAGFAQQGVQQRINMHNPAGKANALLSLDQLKETLPNVQWVGLVVTWFGDNLDAASCTILPGVEYQTGATTSPETWSVGSFTRTTARQITLVDGSPRYGGTPDDESILRLCDELIARGYKILFLPLFFMDVVNKPWRGRVTGTPTAVDNFFTKTNGYNAFVTHYANLVKTKVDAFAIGSEMIGLTKVTDTPGNYPAVNQLVSLAATVKGIVGSGVKVTYAADWSEYHHTDGGWYNMDPLWASSNIDFIGIDAYFPLTSAPQTNYDVQPVLDGWTSGEGYDFYYTDGTRTTTAPLSAPYAWKNIAWFWNNTHYNPGGAATAWVPNSKKIWFTEYGFPSVDGATNQPNLFYDPLSSENGFPYFSRGRVDLRAQRLGIRATEQQWKASSMIERKFLWTWDARPYPYWPDLRQVWADGPLWTYGHWVNGKLGLSNLAAIVRDICLRAGMTDSDIDVSALSQPVEGFVIADEQSARNSIEQLMSGYFFDAVENGAVLKFVPRGGASIATIDEAELLPSSDRERDVPLSITRTQELELPQRVNIITLNRTANYQASAQLSQRANTQSKEVLTINVPIVCSEQTAKAIADVTLFNGWVGRTRYAFDLPPRYAALEPTDLITITAQGGTHTVRVSEVNHGKGGALRVQGVAEDVSSYDFYTPPSGVEAATSDTPQPGTTRLELLDIPAFPSDAPDQGVLRLAATGVSDGWRGAVVYRSDDGGSNYARLSDFGSPSVIGTALSALPTGPTVVPDEVNSVTIAITGSGTLASAPLLSVLNGANAALLGDEILQFTTATLLSTGKYQLSGLLRGRLGTEWATTTHAVGERFVLLDAQINKDSVGQNQLGLARLYKPVSVGMSIGGTAAQSFTYSGRALKPYAPVHISGSRDGSANLTINWTRRTRLGGAWADFADIPLNEQSELYEVDIMNGSNVVRTLSGLLIPSAAYNAAEQITDFGATQSSVNVKVYQLSALVGRGYAASAVV